MAVETLLVVCTQGWFVPSAVALTAEFKFPGSVITKLKSDAVDGMIFIGLVGVGSESLDLPVLTISRQTALTQRCVSSRWYRRPHFGHLVRRGMMAADVLIHGWSKAVDQVV